MQLVDDPIQALNRFLGPSHGLPIPPDRDMGRCVSNRKAMLTSKEKMKFEDRLNLGMKHLMLGFD